jgi:cysteine desulfurase/selenocysteine lyase
MSILDVKKDFPIFKSNPKLVYLDSAASSQTPKSITDAAYKYYSEYRSNIHRSMYKMGETATEKYEQARGILADFIGADKDEIIFTSGATMGMNMLIYSLEQYLSLEEGNDIITTVTEHHSSLIPLQQLAKRKGIVLKHINITEDFDIDYKQAEKLITSKTKIVSVSLAGNVLGAINDIKKITELAHKVGAVMICDATKAIGHIPVNVKEIDCDFLIFSGHKMCGPTGIGVLYGKKELLKVLPPSMFGGGIVEEVDLQTAKWKSSPWKFEAGTPNIAGAIGLGEAVMYLGSIGIDRIHEHISDIVAYAIKEMEKMECIKIFTQKDADKNIGIVAFSVDGIHPHDIADITGREGVAIRAGHHCAQPLMKELGVSALVRASFYLYNDKSDVDALVEAIKKAQEIFK